MPYKDRAQQLAYNRRWNKRRLVLCPLCPSLMWVESTMCQACWIDSVRVEAKPLQARPHGKGGSRPNPANHPWRKSLTRIAGADG